MISEARFGPVTQYKLIRSFWGYRIYATSSYLVDGLLIDTGFQHIARDFFQLVSERPLAQIVHTHAHEDHVAANYLFEHHLGLRAQAHTAGIDLIKNPPANLKLYRRLVWGIPRSAAPLPIGSAVETDHHRFQVLELPGHSKDHIGFYEPNEGWFFGGDLFLSVKVRVLKYDEDYHAWKASLQKALRFPIQTYFCGSGKVLKDANKILELKLEYFEEVENKVLTLHRRGYPLKGIRDEVLGKEPTLTYLSQGEFSKLNLVKSILKGA